MRPVRVVWCGAHAAIVEGRLRQPGDICDDLSPQAKDDLLARGLLAPEAPAPKPRRTRHFEPPPETEAAAPADETED